ncbi:MAG: RluA family pseudouridine synthase [Rhodospirillales bacterium]
MTATTYTVTVAEDKAGARLDRLLADALPAMSRTRLKALIEAGAVEAVGGGAADDPARRVQGGETFAVTVPSAAPQLPQPQPLPLAVVYEDASLIVVDKPAGLVVHPGAGHPDRTLVNALLARCPGGLAGAGGVQRPGIVHRLDKGTSGLMVVAKTDAAHLDLARQFAAHSVERGYFAVVRGVPSPPQGRISGAVGRSAADRTKMAVVARGGKPAATRYRVLQTFAAAASLVECRPETGRTHQIRVHMAALGHPLLGDPQYRRGRMDGQPLPEPVRRAAAALGRQALHAYLIGFSHPESGERLRFESTLPKDIRTLIDLLEGRSI